MNTVRSIGLASIASMCMSFLAAQAAAVTIDFDRYPDGLAVPAGPSIGNQWASLGVFFADRAGGAVTAVGSGCSLSAPNHVASVVSGTIVATFVDPASGSPGLTSSAGTAQDLCWASGEGIAMRAYDKDGVLLASIFNSGAGNFSSFSFSTPIIARIEMDPIGQGIDNFQFVFPVAVPLTASLSLFVLGLTTLTYTTRRPSDA